MFNIIFIAPPAAGKGTLAKLIEVKYNLVHISIGELLRKKSLDNSEEAFDIKNKLEQGVLIDDSITNKIVEETLSLDVNKKFILDGYPRTTTQAIKLDDILNKLNINNVKVIYLNINKEEALKRSLGRISCPKCHKVYNRFKPSLAPKKIGLCDICNSSLVLREDDNEQSFNKRYETYLEMIKPLLEYYETKNILFKIDVTDNPEDTLYNFEKVVRGIEND